MVANSFESAYERFIENGIFLETPDYYSRYKSRYRSIIKMIASLDLPPNARILEVGGGQNAILASKMWGHDATVADVSESYLSYVRRLDITAIKFDLVEDVPFCCDKYDVVVLSEVIEHLPVPPYLVLRKLKTMLQEGGNLIVTTPNLFSARNLTYFVLGKKLFGHFFYPGPGQYCGAHIVEYSAEHLAWQLEKAGFSNINIRYCQFQHKPHGFIPQILYQLGQPLLCVKRFRQSLVATAKK